jgi:hypothetical protein
MGTVANCIQGVCRDYRDLHGSCEAMAAALGIDPQSALEMVEGKLIPPLEVMIAIQAGLRAVLISKERALTGRGTTALRVPSLCPKCQHWLPRRGVGTALAYGCAAGQEGAPRRAVCRRYLYAPGRGESEVLVEPGEGTQYLDKDGGFRTP